MNTTVPPQTAIQSHAPPVESQPAQVVPQAPVVNSRQLAWLIAAEIPLTGAYCWYLWNRPHYQIFPLAAASAVFLAWYIWRRSEPTKPGNPTATAITLGATWLLQAGGFFFMSWWCVGFSLILLFATIIYGVGGFRLVGRCWAIIALIAMCTPPPYRIDFAVVLWLRWLATREGSAVLDWLKIANLPTGNVLQVGSRPLFIEDACSGVNSLFSTLCCVLIYCGLLRRHWLHSLLLLITAVGWLMAANISRIVVIALAVVGDWDIDLTKGWAHDTLGFLTYGSVILLTWSTDQFFVFLSRRSPVKAKTEPAPAPVRSLWPALPFDDQKAWGTVAAFAVLSVAFYVLYVAMVPWPPVAKVTDICNEMVKADLPAQGPSKERIGQIGKALGKKDLGNGPWWVLGKFEEPIRSEGSEFGERSKVWKGSLGAFHHQVVVAVDYPFRGWHDLSVCYLSQGWQVAQRDKVEFLDEPEGATELRLQQAEYKASLLLFTALDENGKVMPNRNQESWPRPGSLLARVTGGATARDRQPNCQVQVLLQHGGALKDEELMAARELFRDTCLRVQSKFKAKAAQ